MVWCVKFCKNFSEKYKDEIWSLDQDIEECISIIDSKKDKQCHFEGKKLMRLRKSEALCVKHLEKIEKYNKSLFNLMVLFYQKNLKETPEPITYERPWKSEDNIINCIAIYCGRNMAMLDDIADHLDTCGIHRDEQKLDVFRIIEITYPVLACVTGPYGDPISMLECFIS